MTVSGILTNLDEMLQRLAPQAVARDNARAAAQELGAGRRQREEVEEFLETHLAERAG